MIAASPKPGQAKGPSGRALRLPRRRACQLSGGALLANIISVTMVVAETLMLRR